MYLDIDTQYIIKREKSQIILRVTEKNCGFSQERKTFFGDFKQHTRNR